MLCCSIAVMAARYSGAWGRAATDVTVVAPVRLFVGGSTVVGIGGKNGISVTFHGVRGSTPCHGDDVKRVGGNTSCVSVAVPGEPPVLFDLGTGLRYFGAGQPHDGSFRATCLLSHLHWDHTQGLPFFTPMLREGSELDVYAPTQEDGRSLHEVFEATIRPPLFPIGIDQFPGTFRFHDVADDEFDVGGVHVTSRLVPHVGNTLGYRIDVAGTSIAYISDHQQPYDGSLRASDGALELARGVDLLIHDAQYTQEEFALKYNWGHCTVDYALWFAAEAGVTTLALFHHDPNRTDEAVDAIGACAQRVGAASGVQVVVAREGLTLDVG
jgi:phosphoribosyl 1,2-cyclic phosphodiesterase